MKTLCLIIMLAGFCVTAPGQTSVQKFHPKQTLGDGKNGRLFSNFSANLREAPVKEIIANVIKISGGDDVYINARFGNDGHTLENGKRNPVTQTKRHQVRWNVGNVSPGGKPLFIKAYNGEVKLLFVQVNSQK